jgi:hypothetical protein
MKTPQPAIGARSSNVVMRSLGVRSLAVSFMLCHHEPDVEAYAEPREEPHELGDRATVAG